jgi:serine/threonine-protein phosphatase 6 regulatory ankyrin repeat subunit B
MGQPADAPDEDFPPLNCAAKVGSVEAACLLVEAGARLNPVYEGETPLMTAVRLSNSRLVRLLLLAGAVLIRVEFAARYARSPDALLPFIDNGDRDRALLEAIAAGRAENVALLLERGARPTVRGLLIACSFNYADIVHDLLAHGVVADDVAMQTCIYNSSLDTMRVLFRSGLAPVDGDVHFAVMHNRPRALALLLDEGAAAECAINGTLPVHVAARHGMLDCLRLLVDRGARVNASDNLGCTPLHWAAIRKNPATLQYLLANGARVTIDDAAAFEPLVRPPTPDWSAIHVSVEGRGFDVVGLLLRAGAKQIPMWDGRWPLHIAVQNEKKELVPVLLHAGADPKCVNAKGQTAGVLARALGRDDIADLIAG